MKEMIAHSLPNRKATTSFQCSAFSLDSLPLQCSAVSWLEVLFHLAVGPGCFSQQYQGVCQEK